MAPKTWCLAFCLLLCGSAAAAVTTSSVGSVPLPVVLWHGMGDNCCNPQIMGAIKDRIEQSMPGVYVLSLMIGASVAEDTQHGFFGSVNDQVTEACAAIAADGNLSAGYSAVGFSQGGQFLRAVAQRCAHAGPPMRQLITLGAQHQGVSSLPGCNISDASSGLCETARSLVGKDVYGAWVKDHVVQAQYFKDPGQLERYKQRNPFLPDINNEKMPIKREYSAALRSLGRLVLFRFLQDTTVQPRDSAWFSFWDGDVVVPLQQTALWREDRLGLRALSEADRLVFADAPGAHMQFSAEWFDENVIQPYLASPPAAAPAAAEAAAVQDTFFSSRSSSSSSTGTNGGNDGEAETVLFVKKLLIKKVVVKKEAAAVA